MLTRYTWMLAVLVLYASVDGMQSMMPGGRMVLNVEDKNMSDVILDLVSFGLGEIGKQRKAEAVAKALENNESLDDLPSFNYSFVEVMSAQRQVVAGLNYFITLRMKDADCKRGCTIEQCDLTIYVVPWQDTRTLTDFTCVKKVAKVGGIQEIDVQDEGALKALEFAITTINARSNDMFLQKPLSLDKASKQVVNGYKYILEFTMARTKCTKQGNPALVDLSECELLDKNKVSRCVVEVWDQPWVAGPRYKLMRNECQSVNVNM